MTMIQYMVTWCNMSLNSCTANTLRMGVQVILSNLFGCKSYTYYCNFFLGFECKRTKVTAEPYFGWKSQSCTTFLVSYCNIEVRTGNNCHIQSTHYLQLKHSSDMSSIKIYDHVRDKQSKRTSIILDNIFMKWLFL